MIEGLPAYISFTFFLTTLISVGFLIFAVRQNLSQTIPAKILLFLIPFWLLFQGVLALGGFYQTTGIFPPRIFAYGVGPVLILIILYFIFFRETFIERLPLRVLTLLHVVRIPVEFVLLWLFQQGQVPQEMTFEGRNFDILSGITALSIYWFAFRNGKVNRTALIVWNIATLLLLVNIVTTAVLALDSPIQQIAFAEPNRGVLFFPFVWLPTVVVPIVLFSHLASLWKLFRNRTA